MSKQRRKQNGDKPRQCFVILQTQRDEHGFIPSLVTEGEPGHSPMTGRGEHATPWYWGDTYERAWKVADRYNKQRYGITHKTALRIMASTMHAQNAEVAS